MCLLAFYLVEPFHAPRDVSLMLNVCNGCRWSRSLSWLPKRALLPSALTASTWRLVSAPVACTSSPSTQRCSKFIGARLRQRPSARLHTRQMARCWLWVVMTSATLACMSCSALLLNAVATAVLHCVRRAHQQKPVQGQMHHKLACISSSSSVKLHVQSVTPRHANAMMADRLQLQH